MDRNALDYLMMITEEADKPDPNAFPDFKGIIDAFGGLKMRIPEGARMSDNVIDRRGGRKPKEGPFVMPDNIERDESGELVWKRDDEQPPIPKMFEHDVLRTIYENVPQSYYWLRDDMRDAKPLQERGPMDRQEMQKLIDAIIGKQPDARSAPLMRILGLR